MRLKTLSVENLFGLFDHAIHFRLEDHTTIIHAPNGYGKTVLLKLIAGFFGGSLAIFRQVEFKNAVFQFDDGSTLTIRQRERKRDDNAPQKGDHRAYSFSLKAEGDMKPKEFDPWGKDDKAERLHVSPHFFERYVPFLVQIGSSEFRDLRTGEIMGYFEAIDKYSEYLPPSVLEQRRLPPWLDRVRKSVHCRLIETQRLLTVSDKEKRRTDRDDAPMVPAVKTNSEELTALIENTLAESGRLSQQLERTFPNRLLRRSGPPFSEEDLRRRLAALEQRRARLTNAGLLDESDDPTYIPTNTFTEETRRILSEYVVDSEKKLEVFDNLLPRIELIRELINTRFQFKTLSINRKSGFVLIDVKKRPVALESLSSGEQHELVLFYNLLFKTKKDTLLLIDEPEISPHIAWQKKFLSDLRQIIQLSPMDIVLSTHSPQLIGGHMDLAIHLRGPKNV